MNTLLYRFTRPFLSFAITLFVAIASTCGQTDSTCDVPQLDSTDAIASYWNYLLDCDQAHRGRQSIDSSDNINFRRMVCMLKQYGWPTIEQHGFVASLSPNIIFRHQKSDYVKRYYFPVFHQAFLEGKMDTSHFIDNLNSVFKDYTGRFPKRSDHENAEDILQKLTPLNLSQTPNPIYDLSKFDSLFSSYQHDVNLTTSNPVLHIWHGGNSDSLMIYKSDLGLYLQFRYEDWSFTTPHQIDFHPEQNSFTFSKALTGFKDEFILKDDNSLTYIYNYLYADLDADSSFSTMRPGKKYLQYFPLD